MKETGNILDNRVDREQHFSEKLTLRLSSSGGSRYMIYNEIIAIGVRYQCIGERDQERHTHF